jgi:hypothetical protein
MRSYNECMDTQIPHWTEDQVRALAPDERSIKAAGKLLFPAKWVTMGQGAQAIWGECQGSSSTPYRVQVDLIEPAFRCSCPSRKFPCKHSLALFLIYVTEPGQFREVEPPDWAAGWLTRRRSRDEKAAAPPKQKSTSSKTVEKRHALIYSGLEDTQLWLNDLVRQGLANIQGIGYGLWDNQAARLVDAKAPGAARWVRQMAATPHSGAGWPDRLLEQLGLMHLLCQAYRRFDTLPPEGQADLRAAAGWALRKDDLLAENGLTDRWSVMGVRIEQEDNLTARRTWLWGQSTHQPALILDFAHRYQPFEPGPVPGCVMDAELVYYPGSYPLRAVVKSQSPVAASPNQIGGFASIIKAAGAYAAAIAAAPWIERWAYPIHDVIPVRSGDDWGLCDQNNRFLPIAPGFGRGWELLALSGGHPISVMGEWDGARFTPLSVLAEGRFVLFKE